MSRSWAGGSTKAWRKLRAQILERDGHRCQVRLPGCTDVATHAHHTMGRDRTGDDPRYIVASCEHCNLTTGQPALAPDPLPRTAW